MSTLKGDQQLSLYPGQGIYQHRPAWLRRREIRFRAELDANLWTRVIQWAKIHDQNLYGAMVKEFYDVKNDKFFKGLVRWEHYSVY